MARLLTLHERKFNFGVYSLQIHVYIVRNSVSQLQTAVDTFLIITI